MAGRTKSVQIDIEILKYRKINMEDRLMIPTQNEMFKLVLQLVQDLPEFTRRQAKELVCDSLRLSDIEKNEKTSSGVAVYESRAGWSVSWLNDANYIERIRRATYRITDKGKNIISMNLPISDFVMQLKKDRMKLMVSEGDEVLPVETVNSFDQTKSPEEILDETIQMMNEQLANSIMNAIIRIEGPSGDYFFEKLVTELIEKMGYGKGYVTSVSNDKGIDGIITTDKLGFDPIMIQAKRYALGNQVGRPEIQAFAGALRTVTRGVFITTSSFSKPAIEFAKSYPHATILLIDGEHLTKLMIEYNLGVLEERAIRVKKLDSDYFEF